MAAEERTGIEVFAKDEFSKVFQRYDDLLTKIEGHTAKTADAFSKSSKAMEKQSKEVKGLSSTLGSLIRQYTTIVAGAYAAYKSFTTLTSGIQDAVNLAARVETLAATLEAVGTNAGYSSAQIAKYVEEVKDAGITTQASMQALLQMAEAHVDFARGAELARIAQNAAVIANVNSSEAFQRMIYGLQSGQVEILRTLGLNVNFEKSYKALADQLGRSKDSLTEQEKSQARVNAVVQAGASIAGSYEAAMSTAGKQVKSMERYLEELSLALGRVFLEGFSEGVVAATDVLKEFQDWVDRNQDALKMAQESFAALTEVLIRLAKTEIDTERLDSVVASMTTLADTLTIIVDGLRKFKEATEEGKRAGWLGPGVRADIVSLEEEEKAVARLHEKAMALRKDQEKEARKPEARKPPPLAPPPEETKEDYDKVADVIQSTFDRIQDMQRSHLLQLERAEEDAARERTRAWADYEKKVAKEIAKGEKKIADLAEDYEKERAEAIEDAQKEIAKAETRAFKDRAKAERDFQRNMQHARQRYNLDRLQSERRYQYERGRLVAEGDTLALQELDERYALEQKEAEENQQLQEKQESEGFSDRLRDMQEAADETLRELRSQLSDTLAEQEQSYQEQLQQQRESQQERLAEMAAEFAERQRLADEDRVIEAQRRDEDYRRQLGELGRSLSDQLREQETGALDVASVMEQYYGSGGITDQIMEAFHQREQERVAITAEQLASMASAVEASVGAYSVSTGAGMAGYGPGLQHGGIVRGPASFHVEPGVVEAVVPLNRMSVSGSVGVNITGLESANPTDVSAIASALARELTTQVHALRRS